MLRRSDEKDAAKPEDTVDLSFKLCSFVPLGEPVDGQSTAPEGTGRQRPLGNRLVIAESLKAYATPDGAQAEGAVAVSVEGILAKLSKRKPIANICCKDITSLEDCAQFMDACACSGNGVRIDDQLVSTLLQWLKSKPGFDRVLCGSTGLDVDIGQVKLDSPSHVCLPIRMLGKSKVLSSPVCYVATEDEQVFLVVWHIPKEQEDEVKKQLYEHCQSVLEDSAPSLAEDSPSLSDLQLPKFKIACCGPADVDLPSSLKGGVPGRPQEIMAVELSGGRPRPGMLRRPPSRELCTVETPFVFCVWHAKLDELDVPLFATVVSESDCGGESS